VNEKLFMKKMFKLNSLMFAILIITNTVVSAQGKTVMVGGASMYPSKNIIENALNSKDHTTLVAAVKAAGLAETLEGTGPFTVFAPTNAAFNNLPAGTVDNLLRPESKDKLTAILTYHVISGKIDSKTLMEWIKKNNGTYTATTVQGGKLMFNMKGKDLMVMDESGNSAKVTIKDVYQSNGVIHVIDAVLLPKS
jgi:uncharacterized surface protein with fasciclin (FAS1) repeats